MGKSQSQMKRAKCNTQYHSINSLTQYHTHLTFYYIRKYDDNIHRKWDIERNWHHRLAVAADAVAATRSERWIEDIAVFQVNTPRTGRMRLSKCAAKKQEIAKPNLKLKPIKWENKRHQESMRDVVAVASLLTLIFKHAIALKIRSQPKQQKAKMRKKKKHKTIWKNCMEANIQWFEQHAKFQRGSNHKIIIHRLTKS